MLYKMTRFTQMYCIVTDMAKIVCMLQEISKFRLYRYCLEFLDNSEEVSSSLHNIETQESE